MQPNNLRLVDYVQSGQAWTADSAIQSIAVLTPYLRFKFTNPSNSGKLATIYNFSGWTGTGNGVILRVYKNASTSVTANTITPQNQNTSSSNTSGMTITYDQSSSDVSGGSLYRTMPIMSGQMQEFNRELIMLYPGNSITISVNGGGLANLVSAVNAIAHVDWIEQNLVQS